MANPYIPSVTVQPVASDGAAPFFSQVSQVLGHVANMAYQDVSYATRVKNAIDKNTFDVNTIDTINKYKTDALENPNATDAAHEYTEKSLNYKNTVLSSMPEGRKQYAENVLNHAIMTGGLAIQKRAYQQNVNIATEQSLSNMGTLSNQMQNELFAGDATSHTAALGHFTKLNQMVNDDLNKTFITPQQAAVYTQHLRTGFVRNEILGQYNQTRQQQADADAKHENVHLTDDFKATLPNRAKQYLDKGWINKTDLDSIRNSMSAMDKQDALAHGINQLNADDIAKNGIFNAKLHGIALDPTQMNRVMTISPKKWGDLPQQIALGVKEHSLFQKGTGGTLGDMQKSADEYKIAATKVSDVRQNKMLLDASSRVKNYMTQLKDDPIALLSGSDQTKQAEINAKNSPEYEKAGLIQDNQERAQALNNIQQKYVFKSLADQQQVKGFSKADTVYLSKGEVNNIAQHVLTEPYSQQAGLAQEIIETYPKEAQDQIRQQLQKTLPITTAYMQRVMNDKDNQKYTNILGASLDATPAEYSSLLDNIGESKESVLMAVVKSQANQDHANTLIPQGGQWSKEYTQFNTIQSHLAVNLLASKKAGSITEAAQMAGEILHSGMKYDTKDNSYYSYPESVTLTHDKNGKSVSEDIPFDNDKFKEAMDMKKEDYSSDQLIDQINVPKNIENNFPAGMKIPKIRNALIKTGNWVVNKNRTGVALKTKNGLPITYGKDEQPIDIEYKDIADNTSELNNELSGYHHKQVRKDIAEWALFFPIKAPIALAEETVKGIKNL